VIAVLDVLRLALFATTALSIARFERNHRARDRILALTFGAACSLSVLATALILEDVSSLATAMSAAVALGTLPLAARMLHPTGIDLLDPTASAFVGFVVGSLSWGLAWRATLAAVAVAGVLAALGLVRHNDPETRIPFGTILLGTALLSTTAAALVG
jgi:hypothetical protein